MADEITLNYSSEHGSMDLIFDSREIYIDLVWVEETHRRKGEARRLVSVAKQLSDTTNLPLRLNARSDNVADDAWVAFFQDMGFTLTNDHPAKNELTYA